ncbi:hypothetical protein A3C98_03910 [Candidatus Roizmanbacteria bacterium RIFCSPHIGHO2_02_FULL_37_15]|uniref:Uncharacterized protein n=1 Tax=Candidatus Roizmanbacteria bacterium RIFCSPLOWO2_01_FULL_37_16 TaxID=1802058 RepID=A0A1F7IKS1_9BACT|nr:MAG: hypothetical protein A2859_04825 [Candidatus Roizmanbacteria bacterium RIFCSPHIGHO2_01_FULL_37_16b]OGK22012.1 MAG: hypothetical protein A3C98_03910 [Candidatus Roizmanbacteria bacterium RIFCSPHIGHO2_02_FULL_37_15]OGK31773.1 MAG: hypothetical protein A3F57_00315 [Candidatus Roizmanbacteria bacterium RIFCSPHIGHO2_12_FULL_36_11]OGK43933.1 MAG: hypothetical protein A3B40_03950 [Candidatus Roizmanbacteria bacterium RIFCSPLOWO2_01_FULL_37_16]OGK57845.1 MAG: hypothetical protein A3I50_00560 [C
MYFPRVFSRKRQYIRQRVIIFTLIIITGLIIFVFLFAFFLFAWYARDLPSPGKLTQISGSSTVFYDRDEKILFEMYKDKNRVPISLDKISEDFKKATISIEDKNFYQHQGVSQLGILRAFLNIILGRGLQGGSTITQQLIKNVLLDPRRTLPRKIKEIILAFEVERRYSKDQILEMYLNEAPYGGSYWGIGSAAKGYFGKEPKDLNLLESAILAGLPQSPSIYSPFIGKNDAWKKRTKDVLRRMREDGEINRNQESVASKTLEKIKFTSPKLSIAAPHFVFYVRDQIEKEFGGKLLDKGVKIKTTLSLDTQEIAEKIVNEEIKKLKSFNLTNSAVVILNSETNEILAMVGSYDFNDEKFGKFNAALGLRQPGSAIKPVTYALAFEKGYTPATLLLDVKTNFPQIGQDDYVPVNYDGKFRGPMQLRFTLGNSINIPAVKLLAMVGIRDFLQKASDMGMESFAPTEKNLRRFGLSITLGGGETRLLDITSAFSIFARGGIKKELSSVWEISDFTGKTIFKKSKTKEQRIFSPEVSFLISHILSDNNARIEEFGANSYLNIPGKTVAVKTGTSNDKRDNWAIGFSKGITIGIWSGNNDNSPMNQKIASGATGASQIFYRLMIELLKSYKDGIMEKPDKVKAVTIDSFLGGLPHEAVPTRSEYFLDGSEPKDLSSFYKKLKISKSTGKLANDVEIRTGNYDEKEYIVIRENDPISTDGKNRWQESIDAWVKEINDDKYHPPTEISESSSELVIVQIKSPSDKETISSNEIVIKGKIASIYPIKFTKFYINGSEVRILDGNISEFNESFNLSDGVYEIKVMSWNEKDKNGDSVVKIGVNKAWDSFNPTPTIVITPTP